MATQLSPCMATAPIHDHHAPSFGATFGQQPTECCNQTTVEVFEVVAPHHQHIHHQLKQPAAMATVSLPLVALQREREYLSKLLHQPQQGSQTHTAIAARLATLKRLIVNAALAEAKAGGPSTSTLSSSTTGSTSAAMTDCGLSMHSVQPPPQHQQQQQPASPHSPCSHVQLKLQHLEVVKGERAALRQELIHFESSLKVAMQRNMMLTIEQREKWEAKYDRYDILKVQEEQLSHECQQLGYIETIHPTTASAKNVAPAASTSIVAPTAQHTACMCGQGTRQVDSGTFSNTGHVWSRTHSSMDESCDEGDDDTDGEYDSDDDDFESDAGSAFDSFDDDSDDMLDSEDEDEEEEE
eukprot:m.64979 g.64979  ORF g.64979 m.64979 type:complete len:354 (-) comp12038_c0_seq1:614-1675(-)